ncbi:hypothetical protein DFJ63DRAFT_313246 [Scheffersomyces coipomensis]|uniref:uncharacterized protein n=1 Tax=Scheffersomyces coipomensis TaxID=1788519 RepID=UPI00315DC1C1
MPSAPIDTGLGYGALIIIAILYPPIAVYFIKGCGAEVGINIFLTFLFHIPGVIHAIVLININENKRKAIKNQQYISQDDEEKNQQGYQTSYSSSNQQSNERNPPYEKREVVHMD